MFKFNNIDEIKNAILKPVNKDFIERGIKIKKDHQLHVCGIGKDEFLEKFVGYENDQALELRKENSFYFTVPIIANTLKPVDKIFSAKGTVKYFEFANDTAEKKFKEILKELNFEDFLFQRWKNIVFYDPNGLFFFEIDETGTKCYPTYKAIESIYDVSFESQTNINYVIFQPEKQDYDKKIYRVVDSSYDYQIVQQGDNFKIDIENSIPNFFGKVPAFFVNNRIDKKTNKNFDTYISEAIILANSYFKDASIHEVYRIKQGMPYVWEIERECPVCNGTKLDNSGETCISCNGTGIGNNRHDIGDKIIINPSMSEKELRPVAGYIQPDLETWKAQVETLDKIELRINAAIWGQDSGDMVKTKSANTTAFEISITEQSKSDKLDQIVSSLEICEKECYYYLGNFYFPTLYKDVTINYSRRYSLKTPEELFNYYITAKEKKVNSTVLDSIYTEYLNCLYDKNQYELKSNLMKLWTKPFFHYTPDELLLIQIDKIDYLSNLYYDEFLRDYEQKKPLYLSSIEEVETALEKYIEENELKEYESISNFIQPKTNNLNLKQNEIQN